MFKPWPWLWGYLLLVSESLSSTISLIHWSHNFLPLLTKKFVKSPMHSQAYYVHSKRPHIFGGSVLLRTFTFHKTSENWFQVSQKWLSLAWLLPIWPLRCSFNTEYLGSMSWIKNMSATRRKSPRKQDYNRRLQFTHRQAHQRKLKT